MNIDGDRLRRARELAAFSLRELSDASGVNAGTIWQLETGRRPARPSTIRKLALALGIAPGDLMVAGDGSGTGKAATRAEPE